MRLKRKAEKAWESLKITGCLVAGLAAICLMVLFGGSFEVDLGGQE